MSEFYTIVCFTKSNASLEYEYTDSSYLLSRVPDLAKTLAGAILRVHKGGDVYKQEYGVSQLPDGRAVVVDERWGLTKKRLVTPGLMSKLNEAWLLLDMQKVHKITYCDSMGSTKSKTGYTNSPQLMRIIRLIIAQLPSESWACEPVFPKNEKELKALQDSDGEECSRWNRSEGEEGHDDEEEGGDDGWCTKGLRLAYETFALEALKALDEKEQRKEKKVGASGAAGES